MTHALVFFQSQNPIFKTALHIYTLSNSAQAPSTDSLLNRPIRRPFSFLPPSSPLKLSCRTCKSQKFNLPPISYPHPVNSLDKKIFKNALKINKKIHLQVRKRLALHDPALLAFPKTVSLSAPQGHTLPGPQPSPRSLPSGALFH